MPLYQAMYSTAARLARARGGQDLVSMGSPLSEEKNDSVGALSQHWPVLPTDRVAWQSSARVAGSPKTTAKMFRNVSIRAFLISGENRGTVSARRRCCARVGAIVGVSANYAARGGARDNAMRQLPRWHLTRHPHTPAE